MNSRCFEVFAFVLIISVRPAIAAPLHILLIVVDDLGWSDVGFYNPQINTPNIDNLASKGVILDNYYVQPMFMFLIIIEVRHLLLQKLDGNWCI